MVRHTGKSFTMVELLVIVAIISILGAILAPALQRGLEQARQVKCVNHQRTLFFGTMTYCSDFNGFIVGDTAKYRSANSWVYPNLDIYSAPELAYVEPRRKFYGATWCDSVLALWGKSSTDVIYSAYKIVRCVGGVLHYKTSYDGSDSNGFLRYPRLSIPSAHIYFGESSSGTGMIYSIRSKNQNLSWGDSGIDFVHNLSANFMFLDGHGKSLGISQLPDFPIFNSAIAAPW